MDVLLHRLLRSLRYRNFRLFFLGQSISLVGTWIQRIAMPWLVYQITGSAFLLGVIGFAVQIPTLLLMPVAGVLTDRWDRYRVLMATQILSMLQALLLAALYYSGAAMVWPIIILGVLLGLINAFDMPVRQAFLIELVDRKEDLGNAVALNSSMVNGARLLGPSIAGVVIASAGEGLCFLLNGLSYLFVIYSLLLIKIKTRTVQSRARNVLGEMKEGFVYTFGFPPFKAIILLLALVSLVGMPYAVLMPAFVKETLGGGPNIFGFLMAASGLGALFGAVFLAGKRSVLGLERLIPVSATAFGLGLIALSQTRHTVTALALMIITGLSMILHMAVSNTILQTLADDDKRGRVMSFFTMAFMGTAPFGSLLAGSAASAFGIETTLAVAGIFCLLGAALFATQLKKIGESIRPVYVRLGIVPHCSPAVHSTIQIQQPRKE